MSDRLEELTAEVERLRSDNADHVANHTRMVRERDTLTSKLYEVRGSLRQLYDATDPGDSFFGQSVLHRTIAEARVRAAELLEDETQQ